MIHNGPPRDPLPPLGNDPLPDSEAWSILQWDANEWAAQTLDQLAVLRGRVLLSVQAHELTAGDVGRVSPFSARSRFAFRRLRDRRTIQAKIKTEFCRREALKQEQARQRRQRLEAGIPNPPRASKVFSTMTLAEKAEALGLPKPRHAMPLLCAIKDALDNGEPLDDLVAEMDALVTIHRT